MATIFLSKFLPYFYQISALFLSNFCPISIKISAIFLSKFLTYFFQSFCPISIKISALFLQKFLPYFFQSFCPISIKISALFLQKFLPYFHQNFYPLTPSAIHKSACLTSRRSLASTALTLSVPTKLVFYISTELVLENLLHFHVLLYTAFHCYYCSISSPSIPPLFPITITLLPVIPIAHFSSLPFRNPPPLSGQAANIEGIFANPFAYQARNAFGHPDTFF